MSLTPMARVFVFVLVCFFPPLLCADSWYGLMRKGDEQMAVGRYDKAKRYYLGALDAAGQSATGQLWQKYNMAYSKSLVKKNVAGDSQLSSHYGGTYKGSLAGSHQTQVRANGPAKAGNGGEATRKPTVSATDSVESSVTSTGPEMQSTAPAYVEILPDGTVRMSLDDYMRDARISGYRPPEKNTSGSESQMTVSTTSSANRGDGEGSDVSEKTGEHSIGRRSFWGQPVSDSTGERKSFGSSEKVGLRSVLSEATGNSDLVGDVDVSTSDYRVTDIKMSFSGTRKLLVTGKVTNISSAPVHNARVYVRLYNETGVFKGRKWSYLKPGRQSLMPGKTKRFKIEFGGYTGTVGSYKIEVIADFKK